MKFKTDLSRPVIISMSAAALFVVIAIGFIAYSYMAPSKGQQSSIAKYKSSSHSEQSTRAESEHYQKQVTEYNTELSNTALSNNTTYISVPSLREENVPAATMPWANKPVVPPIAKKTTEPTQIGYQKSPEQAQKEAANILVGLQSKWEFSPPGHAVEITASDYATTFAPRSNNSTGTINPTAQNASLGTPPYQIMEPFKLCTSRLNPVLNTDVNSVVTADLLCDRLKGARIFAPGYRLVGDNIDMTFTAMTFNGAVYNVTAKAVDIDTGRTMLSGDVDHRYASRILIPALALGIQKAGKLFEDATGSDTIVSNGTVVQSSPDTVSDKRVLGSFIGGLGQQTANVLNADAARTPPIKVEREGNSTISVMFLTPVMNTDRSDIKVGTPSSTQQQLSSKPMLPQRQPGSGEMPDFSQPAGAQQAMDQRQYLNQEQQQAAGIQTQNNQVFTNQ